MDWTSGSALRPCVPSEDTLAVLPSPEKDARATCFALCVARPECVSFRLRAVTNECILSSCRPSARVKGNYAFGRLTRCVDIPDATHAPSASPTISTRTPTRVPEERAPTTAWTSPSRIPGWAPLNWNAFYVPDLAACERLRPSRMGRTISWPNWGGTVEDCAKECQYDARCGGFVLEAGTCSKSTVMESTDVLDEEDADPARVAMVKVGYSVPYWSGVCSTAETPGTCDAFPTLCAWNQGKRGINQVKMVSEGWCGRLPCVAPSSSSASTQSSASSG